MGEVYRATDTQLKRDAALKILPAQFASDAERRARFQREAEVLASLNHPNIAALYGLAEWDGVQALVMEFVEGSNPSGPMEFDDAWKIMAQVADGLEYAHERRIIHRDMKPGNLIVTPEGRVKILDFGLAKALSGETRPVSHGRDSPTLTIGATQAGVILGTAAYMAPEQIKGKDTDRRADIWAFAVVLYELLTGEHPFPGKDSTEIMARAVTIEPNLDKAPAKVRRLLTECLKKEPDDRLRWIGDAARFLEEPALAQSTLGATRSEPARSRLLWPASLLALAAVALWLWLRPVPHDPAQAISVAMPISVLTNAPQALAITRDGSRIAYTSGPEPGQLYIRALDQLEGTPLPGTEGASFPSFSPDGQQISFVCGQRPGQSSQLKKVSLAGGPVQTLMDVFTEVGPPTQSWSDDGNILVTDNGVLKRISANGGNPVVLARPDRQKGEVYYSSPQLLPSGKDILFSVSHGAPADQCFALNPATGERKLLLSVRTNAAPKFIRASLSEATGYLTYLDPTTASLMAVPFDPDRLAVKGKPVAVLEGVQGFLTSPLPLLATSNSGTLIYVPRTASLTSSSTLAWLDRKGVEQPISAPPRAYRSARISPADSSRIALSIDSGGARDIWVYDMARGTMDRITAEGNCQLPAWTPDGKHILYERMPTTDHPAVMWAPADRSAPPSVLATSEKMAASATYKTPIVPVSVSSDGKTLFGYFPLERWLWTLPLNDSGRAGPANSETLRPLLDRSEFSKYTPHISPDGHWLAYTGNDSGRNEIYVTSYPEAGSKITISTDGGSEPFWSQNGHELFYRNVGNNKLMAVDVETSPTFRASRPKALFGGPYTSYDITPDGQRFLVIKAPPPVAQASGGQVTIVFHWLEELRRRVQLPK